MEAAKLFMIQQSRVCWNAMFWRASILYYGVSISWLTSQTQPTPPQIA